MTARTLKLLDLYGAELFTAAVEEVIARGMHDPGAFAALCEQRRSARNAPVPIDVPLAPHLRDRDVIPHDLETYDAKTTWLALCAPLGSAPPRMPCTL